MKRLLILINISFLLFASSCNREKGFTINCKLRSLASPNAIAILTHTSPYSGKKDTLTTATKTKNGYFVLSGVINYPKMCQIEIGQQKLNLIVENKEMSVTGSIELPEEIEVKGSEEHNDWNMLQRQEKQIDYNRKQVFMEIVNIQKKDSCGAEMSKLEGKYQSYTDSLKIKLEASVRRNTKSFGTTFFIYYALANELLTTDEIKDLFLKLDKNIVGESEYYKFIEEEIKLSNGIAVNERAHPFSITTIEGKTISLSNYRGKNLYLYFTASWCDSCKVLNKELEKIYDSYYTKDFDILAIYLDHNQYEWNNFLAKEASKWTIACDQLYWQSPITKRYGVNEIPYGVLIDQRGIIWAVNPTIQELKNKLNN